jgi:ribonuclease HI
VKGGTARTPATRVELYTDGACSGNPGPGGWGVWMRSGTREKTLSGAQRFTTNNRMELTAAIEGLRALRRPCRVALYTDSVYLRRGITEWLPRWRAKGWRTADRQPVKNQDLWESLEEAVHPHEVEWHWVPGHAGVEGNERADRLAREAMRALDGTGPDGSHTAA